MAKPKKAVKNNPYNISYEEVCAEVMGPKQKEQLRRMIGFRFKRHESINLPEEHLQAIEKHLEGRVRKLLAIPTRHLKQEKAEPVPLFFIFRTSSPGGKRCWRTF